MPHFTTARTASPKRAVTLAGLMVGLLVWSGVAVAAVSGAPDGGFGSGGVAQLGPGVQVLGVAVQSDGQVVAVGQSGGRVLVDRVNTAGLVVGSYMGAVGSAQAVAVQPDGKVVVAGTSGGAMFVERLTSGLAPDPGFGSGGVVSAFAGQSGVAYGVAVGADGSVVAAGSAGGGAGVLKLNSGGVQQFAQVNNFGANSLARAVAVQPDGKIVLVGSQRPLQLTNGVIARLTSAGALDGSFHGTGAFTYTYPGSGFTSLNAVRVQADGKIVAAGAAAAGPTAIALRLNADGSYDSGFGQGGVATAPAGQNNNVQSYPIGAYGVGIAGGGVIVAAGGFEDSGVNNDQALYGFTPGGAVQAGFGTGGTVRSPTGSVEACAIAIAPDGSLVTAGDAVTQAPNANPCTTGQSSGGFVSRFTGFGPAPVPAPNSPAAPIVASAAPRAVTATTATLNGAVDPRGTATSYHFEYGRTTAYGTSTPTASAGFGSGSVAVSVELSGLAPGTTYHYRLDAASSAGSASSADATFTTSSALRAAPPTAVTGRASPAELAAVIAGTVDSGGLPATYQVQYGRTAHYQSSSHPTGLSAGAAASRVSVRLRGLRLGTTYHYRLVATNARGTSRGADHTFRTLPRLAIVVRSLAERSPIVNLLRAGIAVRVGCNQACRITGSVRISSASARSLKLGRRAATIAGGTASLRRRGVVGLTLRTSVTAKAALARDHGLKATVRIIASPPGGGPSATVSRAVTLV